MFCEKFFPDMLMSNDEYKAKNFARALEETFVEIDYLLLSEEGQEKMRGIALELKQRVRVGVTKLEKQEENEIKNLAF
jgi:hypothetical protein